MQKHSHLLRLAGTILGLTLLVSLGITVIGLVFHWNTSTQFSNAFFISGAIAIVIGVLTVSSGFEQRADFGMTYAQSAGDASLSERNQRMMADINQRYGMLILLITTGLLLVGIAIAIPQLF